MGNTPSSNSGSSVDPQFNASPNGNSFGSGDKDNTDSEKESGSGSVFRLPLYRGERNAFLPTDHSIRDNDIVVVDNTMGSAPHPVLSVETKIPGGDDPEISPLNGAHDDAVDSITPAAVGRSSPQCRLDDTSRVSSGSPPTVISSSCDSSYGTCSSTLSSLQTFRWVNNADNIGQTEKISYGQSGWFRSVHQGQQGNNAGGIATTQANNILPTPHPQPMHNSASSDIGIFDCIKLQINTTAIPPALPPPKPTALEQTIMTRRNDVSTASLTSLFESCIRLQEDDDNEYYTNDDVSSGHGSYHERSCNNFSRSYHKRSGSMGSVTSRASQSSHNSYYRNTTRSNYTSKASLISAFSSNSQLSSFYTEEEKNMVDGDDPTFESDLGRVRNYHVVTTAALPWMTGTAVNPLLRAAHLLRRNWELQKGEKNNNEELLSEDETAVDDIDANVGRFEPAETEREESIENIAAIFPPPEEPTTTTDFGQQVRRSSLEVDTFGVIEYCDDDDSATSLHSLHGKEPRSPCSLDYSCFSGGSEFGTNPNKHATTFPGGNERCVISPLEDEEEEHSVPIRLFQPADTLTYDIRVDSAERNVKAGQVTLVVPWLFEASERRKLYGTTTSCANEETTGVMERNSNLPMFATQKEQEAYIRSWLAEDAGMPEEARELNIIFYPARYHKYYNSIFALGDICDLIPDESTDVCILEEPEHLNWYRAPGCTSWRDKFCHCIGVIHTNYQAYARDHAPAGFLAAPLLAGVNSLVVQANCHRVVKLSGVLQEFAPMSECIENVHGIRYAYLIEGERRRQAMAATSAGSTKQRRAYFIGKLLWAKGFDQLLGLEATYRERTGEFFEIDVFGKGPDECEIKRAFSGGGTSGSKDVSSRILDRLNTWGGDGSSNNKRRSRLPAKFLGIADHSSLAGDAYSIFINPSLTEVLCTTTGEAIAMGKWAIIPSHPSNAFFLQFPNCLPYRNRREFVSTLKYALINDPPPLSSNLSQLLSWEAATTRCVQSAAISKRDAARKERICKAKEEKTLKTTLSGLWSGDPKGLRVQGNESFVERAMFNTAAATVY